MIILKIVWEREELVVQNKWWGVSSLYREMWKQGKREREILWRLCSSITCKWGCAKIVWLGWLLVWWYDVIGIRPRLPFTSQSEESLAAEETWFLLYHPNQIGMRNAPSFLSASLANIVSNSELCPPSPPALSTLQTALQHSVILWNIATLFLPLPPDYHTLPLLPTRICLPTISVCANGAMYTPFVRIFIFATEKLSLSLSLLWLYSHILCSKSSLNLYVVLCNSYINLEVSSRRNVATARSSVCRHRNGKSFTAVGSKHAMAIVRW